jgi:hypothetical protein
MQRVIFALAACEIAFAFAVRAIPYCMLEHPLQLLNMGFPGGEGGSVVRELHEWSIKMLDYSYNFTWPQISNMLSLAG